MDDMFVFEYAAPVDSDAAKTIVSLAELATSSLEVQYVREGGENNLHAHPLTDGYWFVLAGQARFYSDLTEVFATIGPMQGVCIPHGARYWFGSHGDTPLELLHVGVKVRRGDRPAESEDPHADRVDYSERTDAVKHAVVR